MNSSLKNLVFNLALGALALAGLGLTVAHLEIAASLVAALGVSVIALSDYRSRRWLKLRAPAPRRAPASAAVAVAVTKIGARRSFTPSRATRELISA